MANITVEGQSLDISFTEQTSKRGTKRLEGEARLSDGRRVFVNIYPPAKEKAAESATATAKAPRVRRGGLDLGELVLALKQAGIVPQGGGTPEGNPQGAGI